MKLFNWREMMKYNVEKYAYFDLKKNVAIPKFQRNLVWKKPKKEEFIRTVLEGEPFGVLLIYSNPKTHQNMIIDGLQRFTTLKKFDEDPFSLMDLNDFDIEYIKLIAKNIGHVYYHEELDSIEKKVFNLTHDILKKQDYLELKNNKKFTEILFEDLKKQFFELQDQKNMQYLYEVKTLIHPLWEDIKIKVNIDQVIVPVIMYYGEEGDLPNIFEKLNTGGTKLSKYEVFASSWNEIVFEKVSTNLSKEVENRYKKLIEETDIDIDNYQEGDIQTSGNISLYEFCYALGKRIKNNFLGKKSRYDMVDSIGFSTIVSALGMHLKDMTELKKKFENKDIKTRHLNSFVNAIEDVYIDLKIILEKARLGFNKYIEAQTIAMAITLFQINYDFDKETFETKVNHDRYKDLDQFKKFAAPRYFNEMIRNYWSGNGDNKLHEVVNSSLDNNRYLQAINEDQYRSNLEEWVTDTFARKPKTPSGDTLVFLGFVYKNFIEDSYDKYEKSFVIPKDILKRNKIVDNQAHIGNMFLLHKDLKDYKSMLIKYDPNFDLELNNKLDLYPKKQEIEVFESDFNQETYNNFILERAKNLIDIFVSNLY